MKALVLYGPENYRVEILDGEEKVGETEFQTEDEFVTLNVRRFGAKGDGVQDDTHFIQAAILACPTNSRNFPQSRT